MSDPSQSMAVGGGLSLATTTGFMVAAALVGFILFLVVFVLYLHAKRCYGADPVTARGRSARRLVFAADSSAAGQHQCSLEEAAIKALPSVVFRRAAGSEEGGAECAVCLCELADGEAARVLPRCGHVFHRECIDMWLFSHSTCPLCRTPVAAAPGNPGDAADSGGVVESSASSSRRPREEMAIEIPRRAAGDLQAEEGEEVMSSSTAAAAAIRSLRRMLSRGSGRAGGASPREGGDIEQGRPAAAKTPTSSR